MSDVISFLYVIEIESKKHYTRNLFFLTSIVMFRLLLGSDIHSLSCFRWLYTPSPPNGLPVLW